MKTSIYFFVFILLLFFNSCNVLYIPSVVNAPVFTDKDQLFVSGYLGSSGIDVQTSYSINNHLGLNLNGNLSGTVMPYLFIFDQVYNGVYTSNHSNFDVSLGYYDNVQRIFYWGVYGGFGSGKDKTTDYDNNRNAESAISETSYLKMYIQPQISIYSNNAELSLSTRIVNNYYTSGYLTIEYPNKTYIHNISQPFFEPVLTAKIGKGCFRLNFQVGYSFPLFIDNFNLTNLGYSNSNSYLTIYQPFILSAGLQFRLSDIWKEKH